jgi:poly(beta-D-mannuronate) lyase
MQMMQKIISYQSLIWILTLLALSPLHGDEEAKPTTVTSINELQETVANAKSGTTILLKNGTYNEPCVLKGRGSKEKPIVIQAETIGGVELLNHVTMEGHYLSLIGFRFKDNGGIAVKSGVACRINRCHMNNLKGAQWLRVDSKSRAIEIDHCLFENKENNREKDRDCQLMRIEVTNNQESHHIHHNHFRDIAKGKSGNGYETIQLISRGNPKDGETGNMIESNLFERCDGESEIVSVKSNGNVLRGNTFTHCRGELVLRHGHRNVVNRNWFLHGSGGVRLQGKDQVVVNNYFDGLSGPGIAMMDGTEDEFYSRVERALVAHNTLVNCDQAFQIGINHSKYPDGTAPRDCTIANNIFHQEMGAKSGLVSFVNDQEAEAWIWQGNIFQGVLGISLRKGLQDSAASLTIGDRKLLLPTAKTPTAGREGIKRDELAFDITGTVRPEKGTVGAYLNQVIQQPAQD